MSQSIEVRLPYQEKNLAEFLIALPHWWKFRGGNTSKYLMREIVKTKHSRELAYRTKSGFAHHLWNDDVVYKALNMENAIQESSVFENPVFSKHFKNIICSGKVHRGQKWNAFCFAMTGKKLDEIRNVAVF